MNDNLRNRIAEVLGWSVEETTQFSLQALRELVRPVSAKLADELSHIIRGGPLVEHVKRRQ